MSIPRKESEDAPIQNKDSVIVISDDEGEQSNKVTSSDTLEEVYEKWQRQPDSEEQWAEMELEIQQARAREYKNMAREYERALKKVRAKYTKWQSQPDITPKPKDIPEESDDEDDESNKVTFLCSKQEEEDYINGKTSSIIVQAFNDKNKLLQALILLLNNVNKKSIKYCFCKGYFGVMKK